MDMEHPGDDMELLPDTSGLIAISISGTYCE